VVAVADAFDAMTSNRPYRSAMPVDRAFQELLNYAGRHFDPLAVQAFLTLRPQIEARMNRDAPSPITLVCGP
jgi:HD-GYP domain-containing protein (c-di-GMP phosphodiesterase class II)